MAVEKKSTDLHAAQTGQRFRPVPGANQAPIQLPFQHTQSPAGDAESTIDIVKLPAGRVRIEEQGTRFYHSGWGAGRTLDIGWLAYNNEEGEEVAADPDALVDGKNMQNAGNDGFFTYVGRPWRDFHSMDGVTIQATVKGGSIPNGATLNGIITVTMLP